MTKSRSGKIRESNLSEKNFDKVLGPILTNSKDWNKGRFFENENKENEDTAESTSGNTENIETDREYNQI